MEWPPCCSHLWLLPCSSPHLSSSPFKTLWPLKACPPFFLPTSIASCLMFSLDPYFHPTASLWSALPPSHCSSPSLLLSSLIKRIYALYSGLLKLREWICLHPELSASVEWNLIWLPFECTWFVMCWSFSDSVDRLSLNLLGVTETAPEPWIALGYYNLLHGKLGAAGRLHRVSYFAHKVG